MAERKNFVCVGVFVCMAVVVRVGVCMCVRA